jgi:hypothetical protein
MNQCKLGDRGPGTRRVCWRHPRRGAISDTVFLFAWCTSKGGGQRETSEIDMVPSHLFGPEESEDSDETGPLGD